MRDPRVLFAVMVAFAFHKHRLVSGYFGKLENSFLSGKTKETK